MDSLDDIFGKFDREVDELTNSILRIYKLELGVELDRETVRLGAKARLAAIQAFIDLHKVGGLRAVYRAGYLYTGTETQYRVVISDTQHQKAISIFEVTETMEGTFLYNSGTSVSCSAKLANGEITTLRFIETKDSIVILE